MSAAGWGSLNLTDELPPKGRKPKCRTDNDESSLNQKRARKMPPPSQSSTPTEGLRKKQTTKTQTRVTRFSSERAKFSSTRVKFVSTGVKFALVRAKVALE